MARSILRRAAAPVALVLLLAAGARAQTYDTRVLPVRAASLVYSPATNRLYASVADDPAYPNSVVAIDPDRGEVEWSLAVGSAPGPIAVSGDGTRVYVGLRGAPEVVRVGTAARAVEARIGLGNDPFFGARYAGDIEVQPGNPLVVAVSMVRLNVSPRHAGVGIFDNGALRPVVTPGHTGSDVITFGATPERLYGYNNGTSEFGFRRLQVSADGLREISVDDSFGSGPFSGYGTDILYADGRVYATTGRVANAEARTIAGTFSLANSPGGYYGQTGYLPAPDPAAGRTFFLTRGGPYGDGPYGITAFDNATFARLAVQRLDTVPPSSSSSGNGLAVLRWGTDGLAFALPGQGVVLVRTPLVHEPLAAIAFASTQVDLGQITGVAERTLRVSNPGTRALTVTAVTSSDPSVSFTPAAFSLAPGESLVGTVRLRPRRSGSIQASLSFASNTLSSPDDVLVTAYADVVALGIEQTAVDLGAVEAGTRREQSVQLYASGSRPVQVQSVTSSDPRLAVTPSTFTVSSYSALQLAFSPGTSTDSLRAVVVITSNAVTSPDTLVVRARAVTIARAVFDPEYLVLGDVQAGRVHQVTVTLRNPGTAPLAVTGAASTNAAFSFSPAQVTIPPGASVQATVRFVAARLGGNAAGITLTSNAEYGGQTLYVAANVVPTTAGEDGAAALATVLAGLAPNPVRDRATVRFSLAEASDVRLAVFDVHGREVLRLADGPQTAGAHTVGVSAGTLAAGVYVVRMSAGTYRGAQTLTVIGR